MYQWFSDLVNVLQVMGCPDVLIAYKDGVTYAMVNGVLIGSGTQSITFSHDAGDERAHVDVSFDVRNDTLSQLVDKPISGSGGE